MSSRRLSPKEIKHDIREDELRTGVTAVVDWLVENRRTVLFAIVAVVVAAIGAAIVASVLDSRRESAAAELADVIDIYEAPVDGEDVTAAAGDPEPRYRYATAEERRAAAREKAEEVGGAGSGDAGEIAELYLADIALAEGDAERAREIWQSYLDSHDDGILAASVKLNLLRLDRQEGRGEEVAEALRGELDSVGGPLPEDVVLFELATTLDELGQTDEAQETYQRLVDEHPQSRYAGQARQRTAETA